MQATCSIPTEQQQLQPLGPESLTWRYFGDLRGLLLISRVGLLPLIAMSRQISRARK